MLPAWEPAGTVAHTEPGVSEAIAYWEEALMVGRAAE